MRVVAERGARAAVSRSIAALSEREGSPSAEVLLLVPGGEEPLAARAADSVLRELQAGLPGCTFAVGRSRIAEDPADLPRAASEALLAANVAEGGSTAAGGGGTATAGGGQEGALAFEQTGAYRLLLSTMSENPRELQRFYAETVEPLVAYDEQYETDLVRTLESFLDADGNVAGTAQRLFTHRHTIYYRLERVRELSGLDVSSSDGREKLSPRAEGDARARHRPRRRPRLGGRRRRGARSTGVASVLTATMEFPLGGRPMAGHQVLVLRIGVRVPAPQCLRFATPSVRAARGRDPPRGGLV